MSWDVVHYTNFSKSVVQGGMGFEEAKFQAQYLAAMASSDGLGQTKRVLEAPLESKVPFQVKVETMTAEAGWVLDIYAVERSAS